MPPQIFGSLSGADLGIGDLSMDPSIENYQPEPAPQPAIERPGGGSWMLNALSGMVMGLGMGAGAPDFASAFGQGYMGVMQQRQQERQMLMEEKRLQMQEHMYEAQRARAVAETAMIEKQTEFFDDEIALKKFALDQDMYKAVLAGGYEVIGQPVPKGDPKQMTDALTMLKDSEKGRINWVPMSDGEHFIAVRGKQYNTQPVDIPLPGIGVRHYEPGELSIEDLNSLWVNASKLYVDENNSKRQYNASIYNTNKDFEAAKLMSEARGSGGGDSMTQAMFKEELDTINQQIIDARKQRTGESSKDYQKRLINDPLLRELEQQKSQLFKSYLGKGSADYDMHDLQWDPRTVGQTITDPKGRAWKIGQQVTFNGQPMYLMGILPNGEPALSAAPPPQQPSDQWMQPQGFEQSGYFRPGDPEWLGFERAPIGTFIGPRRRN